MITERMTAEIIRILYLKGISVMIVYLMLFGTAMGTLALLANDELLLVTTIDIRQKTKDGNVLVGYGKVFLAITIIFFFTSIVVRFIVEGINRLGAFNRMLITMVVGAAFCHNLERYIEREMPDKVLLISFITVMLISSAALFNERDTTGLLDGVMVGFINLTVQLLFFSEKSKWMEAEITFFVFGVAFFIKCTEVPAPAARDVQDVQTTIITG